MENTQNKNSEYIFTSPNYIHTMIEYSGEIDGNIKEAEGIYITLLNSEYAIVSIAADIIIKNDQLGSFQDINHIRSILETYVDTNKFNIIYVVPLNFIHYKKYQQLMQHK